MYGMHFKPTCPVTLDSLITKEPNLFMTSLLKYLIINQKQMFVNDSNDFIQLDIMETVYMIYKNILTRTKTKFNALVHEGT